MRALAQCFIRKVLHDGCLIVIGEHYVFGDVVQDFLFHHRKLFMSCGLYHFMSEVNLHLTIKYRNLLQIFKTKTMTKPCTYFLALLLSFTAATNLHAQEHTSKMTILSSDRITVTDS